jgi:O-acetyl-ADP-ribose deacetylase (regulator of RNase III)
MATFQYLGDKADIFNTGAEVLVNPVNCVGSSGTLAGAFARRFPAMETTYVYWCALELMQIGRPLLYHGNKTYPVDILCFPTMYFPASAANLDDIREGLYYIRRHFITLGLKGRTIAFPKLGCGVGGLSWISVALLIEEALAPCDLHVIMCGEDV